MYPALIKTYCTLNVKYFPFDSQHCDIQFTASVASSCLGLPKWSCSHHSDCDIQFISWTHNGQQLDIFYNDSMNTAVYYESANQV